MVSVQSTHKILTLDKDAEEGRRICSLAENVSTWKSDPGGGFAPLTSQRKEKYYLASHRNSLEQQRGNLHAGLEKLTPSVQAYYLGRIAQLDTQIADSKRSILCSVQTMTIEMFNKVNHE